MTAWNNTDFDEEASELARIFWAGQEQNGVGLGALVTKVARDKTLNEEQIRRLSRLANTKAFEQKHAAMTGDNRTPVFELADAEAVIGSLHSSAASSFNKAAEAYYPDLADELRGEFMPSKTQQSRSKLAALQQEADVHVEPTRPPSVELRRCEQDIEDLSIEKIAYDCEWAGVVQSLADESRFESWDHNYFEKNAVAIFGGEVLPELNQIRTILEMPALGDDADVVAKLAELETNLIGHPDKYSARLQTALHARHNYLDIVEKLGALKQQQTSLRKVLRHVR